MEPSPDKRPRGDDLDASTTSCSSCCTVAVKRTDTGSTAENSDWQFSLGDEGYESPLQRPGALREVFAEHVLGTTGFCYSIDPGRAGFRDAGTEVRESCLPASALVCSAWHGCVAATLEWERQRFADERRLLLDPYVHPVVSGAHLAACPRAAVYDGSNGNDWLDPPRFAKLPFKEGDVLVIDAAALADACCLLAEESPAAPLVDLARESSALKHALLPTTRRTAGDGERGHTNNEDSGRTRRTRHAEATSRKALVRCRLARFNVVAVPRRRTDGGWWLARGPGGRVLLEVGAPLRANGCAEAFLEPSDDRRDPFPAATPTVEDLGVVSGHDRTEALARAFSTRPGADASFAFSAPLPLFERGVVVRVVPACYRSPTLDWPSLAGTPLRPGSVFCAVDCRKRLLLGYGRELRDASLVAPPPPPPLAGDDDDRGRRDLAPAGTTSLRHVLYVRDANDGTSASSEAAFFGMAEWHRGHLTVFDEPVSPPLRPGEPLSAPASLAHLVLDCSRTSRLPFCPVVGDRDDFARPRCVVCANDVRADVRLICGCAPYCSWEHARAHRDEHARWCPRHVARE